MDRSLSLYLDVVRFTAALAVFWGHTSGQLFTGGLLWQAETYMRPAVIVFFVLSGFVIAHALQGRDRTAAAFLASRVARIYPVLLTALAMTLVCDAIGLSIAPGFYFDGPWGYPEGPQAPRYLASLLLVNRAWFAGEGLDAGINVPLWSLSYEAFYYALIGIAVFMTGRARLIGIAAVAIFAGPKILTLLPIWALGFALYHAEARLAPRWAWLLLAAALMALALLPKATWIAPLALDYIVGGAFGLTIVAVRCLPAVGVVLVPFAKQIRWLASLTFGLYLFHRPLIQVLAVVNVGPPASWQQRLWLVGLAFSIVIVLARACEHAREPLREWLLTRKVLART